MSPQPSPANTGRYHSQLLNFLNRQHQRLRNQGSILLRKFKLAMLWGGQIALYPIYALFQASRIAGRQIGTKFQQALYSLRPAPAVPADQALQQVLYSLTPGKSHHSQQRRFGSRPPQISPLTTTNQPIQAIASSRTTRRLLIITTANEPLDQLTDAQQQQIQARIVWELAAYWKLWRRWQAHQASRQLPSQSVKPAPPAARFGITDRPQLIAPMRLFYQLMAWVQQGTLASHLNLFDETQLVAQPQIDWFAPQLGQLPTDAIVRSGRISPFDWSAWSETLPDNSQIARLLKAAIRHFFGRTAPAFRPAGPMPQIADPWSEPIAVAIIDRAAAATTAPHRPILPTSVLQLAPSPESVILPTVKITRALPLVAPRLSLKQRLSRLIRRTQVSPPSTNPIAPLTLAPETAANPTDLTWNQISSHELTPTLIDTVATPIGYVKHPLEQVLNWLDRTILRLEQTLGRLWQWLKQNSHALSQWARNQSTK